MSNEVVLQNLRDFTVQIRRADTNAIVGTGVVVSMSGEVVTCAHVAQAALGKHPREAMGAEVGVYFPQLRGGEEKARSATITRCFPQHDDDVVLLTLQGGTTPLGPEQIAVIGAADQSVGHEFLSFGYSPMGPYPSTRADGKILGEVDPPDGKTLLLDPIELKSREIDRGFSGAAVLDVERNLIVGLIAERWFSGNTPIKDDIGWGVNARVLTLDPLNLPISDVPFQKKPAPQPRTDVAQARAAVPAQLGVMLDGAPEPLQEWVGRAELLQSITADWASGSKHITGLIGFGGEGKSSLARKWVEDICRGDPRVAHPPEAVFWWNFYDRPSVDDFFESALKFMSGDRIDPRQIPSANLRAQIIGAMLGKGRYLFVFDGLEVMQHNEGDQYGLLKSSDLREFLTFFADPKNASFALITSRAPLTDLRAYATYAHREVDRLSAAEGRDLLRKIGVKGSDSALDKVVSDWDGPALTLSLIGAYLVDKYQGDVTHMADLPAPTADEPRYQRVPRVLRRYDEHLTEAERAFLTLFSAFRTPVPEDAFEKVFRAPGNHVGLPQQIAALDDAAFNALIKRLTDYRILRYDAAARTYTTHPLIRNHYFARLTAGDVDQTHAAHERIKDYYLSVAGDVPRFPTLDDLRPLIEVVHHACRAGAYDEAWSVYWSRIQQTDSFILTQKLGAWESDVSVMQEFFPNGDTAQEPQVSNPDSKSFILNEVGLCLMSLGRLSEAVPFYERHNAIKMDLQDWHNASIGYHNLADLHAHLGQLAASAAAAEQALGLARRAENKQDESFSLAYQAQALHLRGDSRAAGTAFAQAEVLEREIDPNKRYLYSLRGIQHADFLRRTGEADYARRVTEANLEVCERNHWAFLISPCHRVLGDLDFDAGQLDSALAHYATALKIARGISVRNVLIEALLARGRFNARQGDAAAAHSDLDEALDYATAGGYRRYEADIRIALAWMHQAQGDMVAARAEALRAKAMSEEMGYYWGKVDAEEVLSKLQ
jgi:tetratricopeptide (TPR) repeat protein